mmetsp:Transcript_8002/g.21315  ORF Transcript_8002/g.21315 Transcript_8002/m.21315 type:complete len:232 (+) Transcript_8002:122-817(+)|eukprot:CAMPEP_0202349114 /NCGR_PEP_ID=MMETSP1126-20121109/6744_1 /ASSEMBLY_ACC=CAM_ASM_000457 /TAXON_ID=3047 /ORGANISM="Dunaliella tertiolecta, Strain CCMP1320" /LENGTH=231 /DNA_ID=CAMNT_0048940877 /DNA_START=130 /DNA_END=825 /DNA_ORIENTATION=+
MDSDSDGEYENGLGLDSGRHALLDLSPFEKQLRQQTEDLIKQHSSEIAAYQASLNKTLDEVRKLQIQEQAQLATRVQAAHDACKKRMDELHNEYQRQVELLKGRTKTYIEQLHQESQRNVIEQVAALSVSSSGARRLPSHSHSQASLSCILTPHRLTRPCPSGGSQGSALAARSPLSAGHTPRGVLSTPAGRGLKSNTASIGSPFDHRWIGSPNALHRASPEVLDLLLDDD